MNTKKWYILSIILLMVVIGVVVIQFNRKGDHPLNNSAQKTEKINEFQEEADVSDREQIDSIQGTLSGDEQTNLEQTIELPIIVAPNGENNEEGNIKQPAVEEQEDTVAETTDKPTMELPFVPAE